MSTLTEIQDFLNDVSVTGAASLMNTTGDLTSADATVQEIHTFLGDS